MKKKSTIPLAVLSLFLMRCGEDEGSGCSADDNCKGDRICLDGECVEPSASSGAGGEEGEPAGGEGGEGGEGGGQGSDGSDGSDGSEGASVRMVLVRIDDEPPGDNCGNGGVAVHSGVDVDGNGELSDPEIDRTTHVCNGEDGGDGDAGEDADPVLVRLDEEEPGGNCAYGGTVVEAGIDVDGDGELADTEITTSSYVCNGSGACTVIDNGDSSRTISCDDGTGVTVPGVPANGILDSNFSINNEIDVLFLQGYVEITGSLAVTSASLDNLEGLESLETIGGDLVIGNNALLENLDGLDSLSSIGGDLYIGYFDESTLFAMQNPALRNIDALGNLQDIGGDLYIVFAPRLAGLGALNGITAVPGDLVIISAGSLANLNGLDNIASVGGRLVIGFIGTANTLLAELDALSGIDTVGSDLLIQNNPFLPECEAEWLRDNIGTGDIGGTITISANDDPCSPDPCVSGTCQKNCSQPDDHDCI